MLGRESYGTEYGQNLNTVVSGNKLYYLGTGVVSHNTQGEPTWNMSFNTPQVDLFAVYSIGGQLYGLSSMPLSSNWFMMEIVFFKINF